MPPLLPNGLSAYVSRAALCSTTAVIVTGCGTEPAALAAGVGLSVAATGAIAWTAYRRLSRLRATGTPPLPALARPQSEPPEGLDFESAKKRLLRAYPILSEGLYAAVLKALVHRSVEARKAAGPGKDLQPFLEAQLDELRSALRQAPRKPALLRLIEALTPPPTPTPPATPMPAVKPAPLAAPAERFPIESVQDVIALEPYLIGEETVSTEAVEAVAAFCVALGHERQAVVITAEFLAKRLFNERLSPGLKAESDLFTGIDTVTVLKELALTARGASVSERAVEMLAMEGIFHDDREVAMLAIRSLAKIADKDHPRFAATALISLRLRGFSPDAPAELTIAVVDALALIAAPVSSRPSEDPTASAQALQILLWDGLSRKQNEDIVARSRRALKAAFERRPDLFSDEMRDQLSTQ